MYHIENKWIKNDERTHGKRFYWLYTKAPAILEECNKAYSCKHDKAGNYFDAQMFLMK